MTEFHVLTGRRATAVRIGLAVFVVFSAAVFAGLLRYPADVAGLFVLPSLAAFGVSVLRPSGALLGVVFLFPLLPLLPTNLGAANASLLGYLLLGTAAGRAAAAVRRRGEIRVPGTPVSVPLAAFLACVWISWLTVPLRHTAPFHRAFLSDLAGMLPQIFFYREGDMFLSLSAALGYTLGAFFFAELWQRREAVGRERILGALAAGAAVSAVFAFYQRATGDFIPGFWVREGQAARVNGLCADPNSFGTYLVSLFYLFALVSIGRVTRFLRLSLPFLLAALVFTGSRAAWASFALVAIVLGGATVRSRLWRERARSSRALRRAAVGGLAALVILIYGGYEYALRADATREGGSYAGRLLTLFNRSDTFNHILKGRPTMWYAALRMVRKFPAAGVGVGLYREVMPHFLEEGQTYWWERNKENAHNYFLQVAGELGFPGLAAFVWICVAAFGAGRWGRPEKGEGVGRGAAYALGAFLLTTLGAHPLIQIEIQILFWILVVLLCWNSGAGSPVPGSSRSFEGGSRIFAAGLAGCFLVASVYRAGGWFPYSLYDVGVNPWENMGRPGAWTAQREWFRWTKGSAVLLVRGEAPRTSMRIKLGRPGVAPGEEVEVATRLGEGEPERFTLRGEEERTVVLDLAGAEEEVVPFRIEAGSVWNGLRFRGQRDWRTLGVRAYFMFPKEYQPGYTEGLGPETSRGGLSVRLMESGKAFLWEAAGGSAFVLPIWVERAAEGGRLRLYADRERAGAADLVRPGWQQVELKCRKRAGAGVGVTLVLEDAGPVAAGVGRVSWLP